MIFDEKIQRKFINSIWRLPKLTYCDLDFQFRYNCEFFIPIIRSKSIEHLTIKNTTFNSEQLIRLFRSTPHVRLKRNSRLESNRYVHRNCLSII